MGVEEEVPIAPAANQGQGDNPDLFVHNSYQGAQRRCPICVSQLPVEGYKQAMKNLWKGTHQCAMCSAAACKTHTKLVCLPCTTKLVRKEEEEEEEEEEDL